MSAARQAGDQGHRDDFGSFEGDGGSIASLGGCDEDALPSSGAQVSRGRAGEGAEVSRRYRRGPTLGSGAMGRVTRVHDERLLRDVAWKQGDGRILREARILAQLEHPGIVPIYDVGFDDEDQPFIAMRVVAGRPLSQALRETPPGRRAGLLRSLLQVAEAVAFAHHRGVVHRDLKPANIMLGDFGEAQVVDWGLARVLDEAERPFPAEVRAALARPERGPVGTPGYMSPEQEADRPASRAADVFALGRILGEIVSGGTAESPLSPELSAILSRSTQPRPEDRYVDATAFAADLARYLDGARVEAHTYRPRELLWRFVRAYRVPLVVAALAGVALAVVLLLYLVEVGAERERAEGAEREAHRALARSDRFLSRALHGEARRLGAVGARAESELLAAQSLVLREDPIARGLLSSVMGAPALELVERAPQPCPEAQVDPVHGVVLCARFDGVALWARGAGGLTERWRFTFPNHVARLIEGGVVLANSRQVVLLDLEGRELERSPVPNNPSRRSVADGPMAILEGNETSVLVDLERRSVEGLVPCGGALHSALVPRRAGAHGPGLLAVLCRDGALITEGGTVATPLAAPEREGVKMAAIGDGHFVVGTTEGEVVTLDPRGRVVSSAKVVSGMVRLLEPSPDARLLLVAGEGEPVLVVTLPELASIASFPLRVGHAVWDPSRRAELVSTGSWIERWRLAPISPSRPLRGSYAVPMGDGVVALATDLEVATRLVSAVGPHVALLDADRLALSSPGFVTVKGVVLHGEELVVGGAHGSGFLTLEASTLAVRSSRPFLAVRRLAALEGSEAQTLIATYDALLRLAGDDYERLDDSPMLDLASSPRRRYAIALRESDHGLLRVAADEPSPVLVGFASDAAAVAIGDDGALIYVARLGEVAVSDELGQLVQLHHAESSVLMEVAVSAGGAWVAAGARDGAVFIWSAHEAHPRARFGDHRERVPALAFAPDSSWLATGSWDGTLRVRDLAVLDAPADRLLAMLGARYRLELGDVLGGVDAPTADRSEP